MKTNIGLVEFVKSKVGLPYVMSTSGKILTQSRLNSLIKSNPRNWFVEPRLDTLKTYVGLETYDCGGLIEAYINDLNDNGKIDNNDGTYDTTADNMYASAKVKGNIKTINKSRIGLCVRYSGHVGIYIGNNQVCEARGFSYGVCITKLSERPWTHWFEHSKITYINNKNFDKVQWIKDLQTTLNKLGFRDRNNNKLVVDGKVGVLTLSALRTVTIKVKDKSDMVRLLQQVLAHRLSYDLGVFGKNKDGCDGEFGTKTLVAVKDYQKSKALTINGVVNFDTWKSLLNAL